MFTKTLELVSMYLHEAVGGAHEIRLEIEEKQLGHYEGRIMLDPNVCSLDGFGNRQACTKMAIRGAALTGTLMRTYDTARLGRSLVRLHIEGQEETAWNLIEFDRAGAWYLTVVTAEHGTHVIPLYPAHVFVAPTPVVTDP